jgi:hypothetical protein
LTTHSCNCLECHAIERKRIIQLLEDRLQETTLPDGALYVESVVIKQLIKLIKEEK